MKRRAFLRLGASAATAPVVLSLAPRPGRAHGRIGRSHHAAELRLNANENPLGLSDAAREAAVEALDLANRYPSGARGPLLDALARKHDVGEESIVLGNGSTEMIQVAVQSLAEPGYRIVTADPTFDDVGRYAGPSRVEVVKLPLTADWQHDLKAMEAAARGVPGPVLLYVCNPNNPTGTLTSCDDVEALVGRLPENVHVLIDEAYFEYVEDPGYRSFDRVAAEHPRVVVIRTFSKVHGMAGMRLGYAIAHPDTVGRLAHFTADNAADQLVLAAARASLADEAHVGRSVERNREAKRRLYAHLEALEVEYIPSEASFVMHRIRGDLGDYIDRMREEGIRVGRPFPPLLGYNRLSLALPDDMDRFGGVLREFRRRGWV